MVENIKIIGTLLLCWGVITVVVYKLLELLWI